MRIRLTMSIVFERVDPPAPHVTETNAGSSERSSCSALKSCSYPSGVFGGKNSKEKTGSSLEAMISSMRMAAD